MRCPPVSRHLLRSLALAAALAPPAAAKAADDSQVWIGLAGAERLSDHWRLSQEAVARFSDTRGGLYEIESTVLVGYRIAGKLTVWAGYTHDPNYVAGRFTIMEQRAREQVTLDNIRVGPGRLNLRLRLEQRWRNGVADVAWRLRPFARYSLPLARRLSLNLSHESFVDLNTTGFQRAEGEERMRNLVALAVPIGKHMTAEAGFLQQHGFVRGAPDTRDNAASFTLSFAY